MVSQRPSPSGDVLAVGCVDARRLLRPASLTASHHRAPALSRRRRLNAGGEPRPMAGARHEWRLLGVGSTAMLGWRRSGGLPGGCPPPRHAVTLVGLPDTPTTPPRPYPAPAYLMTSSACKRTDAGIVRPRALAVLRLMISSNFVGCSTGRSAGLAPFRILST